MRALLLHTDEFKSDVVEKSTRPNGIEPEDVGENGRSMSQNLTVFFCVEAGDDDKKVASLFSDIVATANDFGTKDIMIAPFVHLSNKPAEPKLAKSLYNDLIKKLERTTFRFTTSQFGYHKSLLLKIKGHPGSYRYREY